MEIQPNEYIHDLPVPEGADEVTQNRIKCLNKLEKLISSVEMTGTFPPARKGQFTKLMNSAKKDGLNDLATEIERLKNNYTKIPKEALQKAAAQDRKRGREEDESDIEEEPAFVVIEAQDEFGLQPMDAGLEIEDQYSQQLRERVTRLNMQYNAPAQKIERVVGDIKAQVTAQGRRFVQGKRQASGWFQRNTRTLILFGSAIFNVAQDAPAYVTAGSVAGPLGVGGALAFTAFKTVATAIPILVSAAGSEWAWNRLAPGTQPEEVPEPPPISKKTRLSSLEDLKDK